MFMSDQSPTRRRRQITPYLLIAPTLLFLAAFFAYPMFQGLVLAVYDDEAEAPVHVTLEPGATTRHDLDFRHEVPSTVRGVLTVDGGPGRGWEAVLACEGRWSERVPYCRSNRTSRLAMLSDCLATSRAAGVSFFRNHRRC